MSGSNCSLNREANSVLKAQEYLLEGDEIDEWRNKKTGTKTVNSDENIYSELENIDVQTEFLRECEWLVLKH